MKDELGREIIQVGSRRRVSLPGDRDLYLATVGDDGVIVLEPAVVQVESESGEQ